MKIELQLFFLEYYISCSQSGENFNFSSRPEFPRFCFKSIRTDEEQGTTHYHDGSLLLLNTTFLHFLSNLNGCCDASEINVLMNIFKKSTFSIINNLYAVLNLSRLMTIVYGSANINKKLIKYHVHFLFLSTMPNWKCLLFRLSQAVLNRFIPPLIERTIHLPNLLSVEQTRSPHILPESRAFKNVSPHISLTSPHKVPVFPHIRGSRWQVHKHNEYSPQDRLGKYSTMLTSLSANNC